MIKLNKKPNILVIGDLMIDHYLWGSCDRISPEAPVQVVNVKKESSVLGGAGNVINNLVTLGSVVDVISVIGNDSVANELIDVYATMENPNDPSTAFKIDAILFDENELKKIKKQNRNIALEMSLDKNIEKFNDILTKI